MKFLSFIFMPAAALVLPGMVPREYDREAPVEIKTNTMKSISNQLPYNYYYLPFCEPKHITSASDSLGEVLRGEEVMNTPYTLKMQTPESCVYVCTIELNEEKRRKFKNMIDDGYRVEMVADGLPGLTQYIKKDGGDSELQIGYPIGTERNGKYYVHNHVQFDLNYHYPDNEGKSARIVGHEITPRVMSQKLIQNDDSTHAQCSTEDGAADIWSRDTISFTFSATWAYSELRWASRFDHYLKSASGTQIHWFSIINSLMIVLLLTGMIAGILFRNLRRDIARYNDLLDNDEAHEESGWKLVHGDVFRKPWHSRLLSMSVGTGIQLLVMAFVCMMFSLLGFINPVNRGSLIQGMLLVFTILGSVGGYTAIRFYTLFGGEDWKTTTLLTAFLYPGVAFGLFFFLNLLIWSQKSSGAVPFPTMLALLLMWFGISVPLTFLGARIAVKKDPIECPVKTNTIVRPIPQQAWYFNGYFSCMMAGVLPFGAIFTELFFIMGSIWQHRFYYLFGFLFLVLVLLVITCAEVSIAMTYFHLADENHVWWWRSFFSSASSSVYIFLYACVYFSSRLRIVHFVSTCLYFGYMFLLSYTFFLITGAVGVLSTFFFLRIIYGSIKID